jgi:hypothetical protein
MERLAMGTMLLLALSALPAYAEEQDFASSNQAGPLTLDVHRLGALLGEVVERTRKMVENYIEIEGGHRPGLEGDAQGGTLTLRVYPKGKNQSDEHYTAESWFKFSAPQHKTPPSNDSKPFPSSEKRLRLKEYL